MPKSRIHLYWLLVILLLIFFLVLNAPEEKSLGTGVRIVYLHGAWVLAAELVFLAAAFTGLIGLVSRRRQVQDWSAALGRAGILFWITYLPLSIWAMQANWNGLFLTEPRFRLAAVFAVSGLLLQSGLWLAELPWLTSLANLLFFIILRTAFSKAAYVMHPPPSPIFSSGLWNVILFFLALNLLSLLAAYWLARWFLELASRRSSG
jgi:hypothetical protein